MENNKTIIKQFILDTLLEYKLDKNKCAFIDNESLGYGERCVYLDKTTGKTCAIGKWMNPGPWQSIEASVDDVIDQFNDQEQMFKKRLLDLNFSVKALTLLQQFHDNIGLDMVNKNRHVIRDLEDMFEINLDELKDESDK